MGAEDFMAAVARVQDRAPALEPLQAALLVAVEEGVAADTRSFAKIFGIAHALTLRATTDLDDGFLKVASRDPRTQRTRIELTEAGRRLFAEPLSAAA